jgi:hypothetical protein
MASAVDWMSRHVRLQKGSTPHATTASSTASRGTAVTSTPTDTWPGDTIEATNRDQTPSGADATPPHRKGPTTSTKIKLSRSG